MTQITTHTNPFTIGHVLRITLKHIRKDINTSIEKTFERVKEFDGNPEKSKEVFDTLATLHALRKKVDEFQLQNKESFKE